MDYRVILVCNGEYRKTLHRCKTRETAFLNYHKFKERNKVLYPKKFINTKGIKPVKYEICITKPTEHDDVFRVLRDDYGKLYTEQPIGDWTILEGSEYHIEETFYVWGLTPYSERPNITEVIKRLVAGAYGKKMVKQVIVVHNKLIIYHEEQFDMIVCKNLEEAQRLHHTLAKIAKKQKIKSLLFMGTAQPAQQGRMYDLIHEKTKWSYKKIGRKSTRP